jgi:16S rRNA (uracil1498-N3)-methyltransferase
MISRFFCPFPLHAGATVQLPDEAAHHALKVLRVSAGDTAILFDGQGGQWRARLDPAGKQLRAKLETFEPENYESPIRITLAQCLPTGDKMDYVVQKAVELGVARIVPVVAKRSVVRLSGERMQRRVEHWQAIAIAACGQCGRNLVPHVESLVDLPAYLASAQAQSGPRWICQPTSDQAPASLRAQERPASDVTILVGPEGGFDESEMRAAHAAGFAPLQLGSRVLRTETAGPAAIAGMLALWGDW